MKITLTPEFYILVTSFYFIFHVYYSFLLYMLYIYYIIMILYISMFINMKAVIAHNGFVFAFSKLLFLAYYYYRN